MFREGDRRMLLVPVPLPGAAGSLRAADRLADRIAQDFVLQGLIRRIVALLS